MNTDTNTPPSTPIVANGVKPIPPIANAEAKLRAIAEKQGTLHTSNIEHLWGAGKDLWASDEEFESFIASNRAIRPQKD
ncbi:MAG: hypothetical protein U0792_07195 [Gemmataceae bacterium]